jgi:hypothetical protein
LQRLSNHLSKQKPLDIIQRLLLMKICGLDRQIKGPNLRFGCLVVRFSSVPIDDIPECGEVAWAHVLILKQ